MPLAFQSLSHGQVAFGFFNIETDLLLLEHVFFFANMFCSRIESWACQGFPAHYEDHWTIYDIPPQEVGDLMGAIHGVRFSGFIGEIYTHFPFPKRPEQFKQNPDGFQTRELIQELLSRYGTRKGVLFRVEQEAALIQIGPYGFSGAVFGQMLEYVWRGGYPGWRDELRPSYVIAMRRAIMESRRTLPRSLSVLKSCKFVSG